MKAIIKSGAVGHTSEVHVEPIVGGDLVNLTDLLPINGIEVSIQVGKLNEVRLEIDTIGLALGIEQGQVDVEYLIEQLTKCIGALEMRRALEKVM